VSAVRLPLRLDVVPTDELNRLLATPSLWWEHRLGGGGWFLSREHRELLDVSAWPGFLAVADMIPAQRHQLWVSLLRAKHQIGAHRDQERGGAVRVHVPLVGAGVFEVGSTRRYTMKVGEFWAVDTVGRPHGARNDSEVDRVHLLVDVLPNDWLRRHVPWL